MDDTLAQCPLVGPPSRDRTSCPWTAADRGGTHRRAALSTGTHGSPCWAMRAPGSRAAVGRRQIVADKSSRREGITSTLRPSRTFSSHPCSLPCCTLLFLFLPFPSSLPPFSIRCVIFESGKGERDDDLRSLGPPSSESAFTLELPSEVEGPGPSFLPSFLASLTFVLAVPDHRRGRR